MVARTQKASALFLAHPPLPYSPGLGPLEYARKSDNASVLVRLGPHAVCRHPWSSSPAGDYVWPGLGVGFLGFFLSMKREGVDFLTMTVPGGGVGRGEGRGLGVLPILSSSASWSAREGPLGVPSCGFLGVIEELNSEYLVREGVRAKLVDPGRDELEGEAVLSAETGEGADTIGIDDGEGTGAGAGRVPSTVSR